MPRFRLRFPVDQISALADRYGYANDTAIEQVVGPFMRNEGYLTKTHFLTLTHWKSPRTRPRCEENSESFIEAVTRTCAKTKDEQLRIKVLTLLSGVSWPTASVILHFGARDPYPILDVRALWSLGYELPPEYDFAFWWSYVEYTRELATQAGVSMRVLDRALWQHSKERQGRVGAQ
jgi:hypothetical protein